MQFQRPHTPLGLAVGEHVELPLLVDDAVNALVWVAVPDLVAVGVPAMMM